MARSSYLERLRALPEHKRKQIALGASLGITAVIFVVWLASFAVSVTNAPSEKEGFFSSLAAIILPFKQGVVETVDGVKSIQQMDATLTASTSNRQ